jgi:hypothetical protein
MNTRELLRDLHLIGIPATDVVVGGSADDHYCIQPTANGQWEVYFYERGGKQSHIVVADEHTACIYLFGELTYNQVWRGELEAVQQPSTPV